MATYHEAMTEQLRRVNALGRWQKAVAVILLFLLPFFLGELLTALGSVLPLDFFHSGDRYMFRVLDQAGIYVLLALGLNIVVGYAGLLDLGYVAFYAVGAYTYALLASPQLGLHLPFWLILPIAPLIAATFGVLLGAPTLRLRGDYLAIVTLGFGEMIRILLNNLDVLTNGPRGINNIDSPKFISFDPTTLLPVTTLTDPKQFYYVILVLVLGAIFFISRIQNSRIGRAWAAIREDEDVARAMGINTTTLKLLAFAMGASTAGFGGVIFSGLQGFVSPESFILLESILILSMVVLGGMGSIPGVVLGAIILTVLPEVLREFAVYRMAVFGLGLTIMMLVRPEGIWPSKVRKRELHSADTESGPGELLAGETEARIQLQGTATPLVESQQGQGG